MSAAMHYRIDRPSVVSETIDGEAVVLDLRCGSYVSIRGSGAVIWAGLEGGASVSEIAARLRTLYPTHASAMVEVTETFIGALLDQHLIVAGEEPDPAPPAPLPVVGDFALPMFERYSDMEDLLMLDPIHDVESEGWPVRKPSDALG